MKGRSASLVLGAFARFANGEDGPVTRVVSLLEEMQGRIEADGEAEQKVYDKFACWCETTTGRKSASITGAREDLKQLGTTILKLKGTIASRSAEIKELIGDSKENEEAQNTATKIRSKENAAYMAESAETQQAAAAMEKALTVLSSHTLLEVSSALRKAQHVHLSATQTESLQLLEQEGRTGAAYAPQSATIQGILGDMYETFAKSLEKAQHNEATAHRNFEKVMKTKQDELLTMQETLSKKQSEKAESETMLADASQNYEDTEAQMHGDVKFFDATKESCEKKTEEWSERKRLRNDELEGISEALKILTSDEARELFSKSIKPGRGTGTFLQVAQQRRHEENPVSAAFDTLKRNAQTAHSVRLAALAASVHALGREGKSGHFDDVLKSIDTLLDTLKQEQKDDDDKASDCKEQFQDLTSKIDDLGWKIDKNEAKIQKLEEVVAAKESEKAKTVEELQKIGKDIEDMKSERKTENEDYLAAKDDDEKASDLLKQAREKLEEYYKENALVQLQSEDHAKPDGRFSDKNGRKNESKGIVSLLTMIIEDLEEELKSGKASEESSQEDFEKRLEAAEELESDLKDKQTNLDEQISLEDDKISDEQDLHDENSESKENEEQTHTDIQPECDWIIAHLAERREKRKTEMDGLVTAKQFLAGAKPQAGLAELKRHVFDDAAFGRINFGAVSFLQRRL